MAKGKVYLTPFDFPDSITSSNLLISWVLWTGFGLSDYRPSDFWNPLFWKTPSTFRFLESFILENTFNLPISGILHFANLPISKNTVRQYRYAYFLELPNVVNENLLIIVDVTSDQRKDVQYLAKTYYRNSLCDACFSMLSLLRLNITSL